MQKLTGRWYLKKGFFGYQIYVEVEFPLVDNEFNQGPTVKRFIKASPENILELKIITI